MTIVKDCNTVLDWDPKAIGVSVILRIATFL